MGNLANVAASVGPGGVCGPPSVCSVASCSDCRMRCSAGDALGPCARSPPPTKYDYPAAGQSTPQSPLDSDTSPRIFRGSGGRPDAALGAGAAVGPLPRARPPGSKLSPAEEVVQNFVRDMLNGIHVVLMPAAASGVASQCIVSLDGMLKTMSILRTGKAPDGRRRCMPLEQISGIVIGSASLGEVQLPSTELCVTLLFEGGQPVTLEFSDFEERDTFALCLAMFVDTRRGEHELRSV